MNIGLHFPGPGLPQFPWLGVGAADFLLFGSEVVAGVGGGVREAAGKESFALSGVPAVSSVSSN